MNSMIGLFLLLIIPAITQAAETTSIIEATTANAFVPHGWKVVQKIEGELSDDNMIDIVLQLRKSKGQDDDDTPEKLVVLIQTPEKTFRQVAVGENILLCSNCYGALGTEDGLANIKIKKGVLILDSLWGSRQAQDIVQRFRYDKKEQRMALIGQDTTDFDRATGDSSRLSVNYLTGDTIDEVYKKEKLISTKKTKIAFKIEYLDDVNNHESNGN